MTEALQPVAFLASATVLNTGSPGSAGVRVLGGTGGQRKAAAGHAGQGAAVLWAGWITQVLRAALLRRHAADHLSAVSNGLRAAACAQRRRRASGPRRSQGSYLLRVECAILAGNALTDDLARTALVRVKSHLSAATPARPAAAACQAPEG